MCLIIRFQREWSKLQRNNFGEVLPDLNYDNLGSVKLLDGRQRLLELAGLTEGCSGKTQSMASEIIVERKRILVVDDEQEVANAIHCRLAANGFDVKTVYDGVAGLEAAQLLNPDAILLDIRLPEMNGLEVLDKLQIDRRHKNNPSNYVVSQPSRSARVA